MFDLKSISFHPAVTYEYVVFWRRGSEKIARRGAVINAVLSLQK
ncbi:hypothetical protein [Rhizobium terrae]|nr:hypothetical protein [Rhizobium terrae]